MTDLIRTDPGLSAGLARSIVSCPGRIELAVDGVPDPLLGIEELLLDEDGGQPLLTCPPATPLAEAARTARGAVLTMHSGIGEVGSPERAARVSLAGRLIVRDDEVGCACCADTVERLILDVDRIVLRLPEHDGLGEQHLRPTVAEFFSHEHHLNRGYLQRATQHANEAHQTELCRSVAGLAGVPSGYVGGVSVDELTPGGMRLSWVDTTGAQQMHLCFDPPARTPAELGEHLRHQLRTRLC